jgi:hypothetical protein
MRWLLLCALLVPSLARANMAKPTFEGQPAGEPGGIRGIAITDEHLTIDMRQLAMRAPAHVIATYHLANPGPEQRLSLVFVTGVPEAADVVVTLDGHPITSASPTTALPTAWNPPATTPGLDGGAPRAYELDHRQAAIAFELVVPSGSHEVTVRYSADPMINRWPGEAPNVIYQLGYVLAPARAWGSFANLDVTIDLPAGWDAAVTPAMERDGDTLHAKFATLPADTIGITTTAPTNTLFRVLHAVTPVVFWLVVVAGPFALWRLGARRGRGGREAAALLHGLGYTLLVLAFGALAIDRGDVALAAGQIASHGYADAIEWIGLVLLLIVAWPIGGVITRAAWKRHRLLPV